MPSASSCEFIEVEMCQGLSYNLTSFPNIWLSIADQREAATLLRQYRVTAIFMTYQLVAAVYTHNAWTDGFLTTIQLFQARHSTSHTPLFSVLSSRYWWSWHASSPCGGFCVECFCPSAALRVVSSSPAAQSALLQSSNAAKPWISYPSAGPSTATSCLTHKTPWSARCLDASNVSIVLVRDDHLPHGLLFHFTHRCLAVWGPKGLHCKELRTHLLNSDLQVHSFQELL